MLPPTSTTTTPAGDTARNPHRHLRPQPQQPRPRQQQPRPQRLPPKLPQQRLPQLRRFVALLLTVILKPVTYRLGQTPETPHLPVSTSATRTRETLNYSPARLMATVLLIRSSQPRRT